MALLGIEIGGTKLQSAVVEADGTAVAIETDRVAAAEGAGRLRQTLAAQLARLLANVAGRHPIAAAGVGFGGPVDRERGLVAASFHVEGWSEFPLREWVSSRLGGLTVLLENDSNAAAFAEATVGAGRGARSVLYSNVGSGIGAGLVIAGAVYHGCPPGEMELGHLRMGLDGEILEDLASGWSIDRRIRGHVAEHPQGTLARIAAGATASAANLGPAIAAGDAAAALILDDAARHYALGLSHAVNLLHPDVVVLGGGVAQIGGPWRDAVARHLEGFLMAPFRPGPAIRVAALGQTVVPVGAALLAADGRSRHV